MSTPNPLVPQGTNANAPKVKSNIKIAVATILAIHVVLFGGLLLQGCKRDGQSASMEQVTNALPTFDPGQFAAQQQAQAQPGQPAAPMTPGLETAAAGTTPMPSAGAPLAQQPMPAAGVPTLPGTLPQPEVTAPPTPAVVAPAAAPGEYTVKAGDSFERIAKANGTTTKAIAAANPGVDSRRLKINQKLVLPPPSATAPTTAAAPTETTTPGMETYTVKSGDSLTKIASMHKTTVKALRAANSLKTDTIRVGQKLKVPVKIMAEAPPAVLPPTAAPTTAAPVAAPSGGQ